MLLPLRALVCDSAGIEPAGGYAARTCKSLLKYWQRPRYPGCAPPYKVSPWELNGLPAWGSLLPHWRVSAALWTGLCSLPLHLDREPIQVAQQM